MTFQYLVGPRHFSSLLSANIFNLVFLIFIISEISILLLTSKNNDKKNRKDKYSFWVITFGIWFIISLDFSFKDNRFKSPEFIFWIGLIGMTLGIIFRIWSIFILRKFFTVSVQTNKNQKLIKKGLYKIIRHPAYSSSLLTILSISFCMRNYIPIIVSLIVLIIIYGYRIKIEEKALIDRFGEDYIIYKSNTYKLIPYIY